MEKKQKIKNPGSLIRAVFKPLPAWVATGMVLILQVYLNKNTSFITCFLMLQL